MREMVFKNLTSTGSRKKDIFLQEVFEKDGIIAKTERRCFYFIKNVTRIESSDDLQKWINSPNEIVPASKRQFYVYKEHSDELGIDKVVCKILGTFYAVVEDAVYTIAFLHSFRVRFVKSTLIQ